MKTLRSRQILAASLSIVAAAVLVTGAQAAPTPPNYKIVYLWGFSQTNLHVKTYTYDFGNSTYPPTGGNAEWPIDIIFRDNSSVQKVQAGVSGVGMGWGWPFASTEDARIDAGDGKHFQFTSDAGKKTGQGGPFLSTDHIRVYGAYGVRTYTTALGYSTEAEMHVDHHECAGAPTWFPGCNSSYNNDEEAENWFIRHPAASLRAIAGWDPRYDYANLWNSAYAQIGNRLLDNDGLVSEVWVP
jgi:hypothetical protein